jgi:hypothetical protein
LGIKREQERHTQKQLEIERRTYLGDSNEAVANKRFERGDRACLFVSTVPHLNSYVKTLVLAGCPVHHSDVDWHVTQILGNLSSWSGNSDFSGFNLNLD